VWRELKEEIGTERAEILGESRVWFHHEVPSGPGRRLVGDRGQPSTRRSSPRSRARCRHRPTTISG
jgi:hypothetical protein